MVDCLRNWTKLLTFLATEGGQFFWPKNNKKYRTLIIFKVIYDFCRCKQGWLMVNHTTSKPLLGSRWDLFIIIISKENSRSLRSKNVLYGYLTSRLASLGGTSTGGSNSKEHLLNRYKGLYSYFLKQCSHSDNSVQVVYGKVLPPSLIVFFCFEFLFFRV